MSEQEPEGLREAIEALTNELQAFDCLADAVPDWIDVPDDYEGGLHEAANRLRAILAAHEAAPEPEAEVVEEFAIKHRDGWVAGPGFDVDKMREMVASPDLPGAVALVRRTRTVRPDVVTDWEAVTDE